MTVLLGALAAVLFGTGDVIGGIGGRRSERAAAPAAIAFIATCVGAIVSGLYLLANGMTVTASDVSYSVVAGVLMSAARPLLYRGMARGPMAVFSPVFSLVMLAVPVVLGPLIGQSLELLEVVGLAFAVPAIVLVSSTERLPTFRELTSSPAIGPACLVGTLVGLSGVFLSLVSEDAGVAPAFWVTLVGVIVVPAAAKTIGQSVRPDRATAPFGVVVGLTSIAAFAVSALVFQRGGAAVGSALIGLAPGVSIVLAWKVLGERIWPIQIAGGALGAVTVILFALSS